MNIIVCIKQVPDTHCQIIPNENGESIDEEDFFWTISPEDECVVEQALQISEQISDCTVTAIRVGAKKSQEALVSALAMGVDNAILVKSDEQLDPYQIAKALAGTIKSLDGKSDLILCGNISYDSQNQQVPQLLAQMLDLPAMTRVIEITLQDQQFRLGRICDGGRIEIYQIDTPIVIACSYGITEPRYSPLPHIKRAEKQSISEMSLDEVGVEKNDQRLRYKNFRLPVKREQGRSFNLNDVQEEVLLNELVDLLCEEVESFQKSGF